MNSTLNGDSVQLVREHDARAFRITVAYAKVMYDFMLAEVVEDEEYTVVVLRDGRVVAAGRALAGGAIAIELVFGADKVPAEAIAVVEGQSFQV